MVLIGLNVKLVAVDFGDIDDLGILSRAMVDTPSMALMKPKVWGGDDYLQKLFFRDYGAGSGGASEILMLMHDRLFLK